MSENSNYLIGADFYFHVVQLNSTPAITQKKNKKEQESPTEYFFQTLVREHEKY